MGWASFCKTKGHWFSSPSGPMLGLWATPLVGVVREATHRSFSPSSPHPGQPFLLPSPPLVQVGCRPPSASQPGDRRHLDVYQFRVFCTDPVPLCQSAGLFVQNHTCRWYGFRPACPLRDGSLTRPPSLYSTTVCWLPRDCGPRLPCPLPHGPPKKTFVLWQRRWLPLCSFSQDVACFWSGAGSRSPLLHGGSLSPRLRAQLHGRCLTALSSP